jgi:hypothetical protein
VLARICRATAVVAGLAVACVGVLAMGASGIVLVAFLSAVSGLSARFVLGSVAAGRQPISGIVAAALTAGVVTALIGAVVILGAAAAAVLPVPVLIGVASVWSRLARGPASPVHPPSPIAEVESDDVAGLRLAWDRSCTLLRDLPPGPVRWALADERRRLLDRLELQDPAGFDQWLRAAGHVDDDPPSGRPSR